MNAGMAAQLTIILMCLSVFVALTGSHLSCLLSLKAL